MHLFEYALRDFMHVEAWSEPNGAVLLHDCLPLLPLSASRERRSKFWVGDVWKVVSILRELRPELRVKLVATAPSGLCVVRGLRPSSRVLHERFDEIVERYRELPYPAAALETPAGFELVPRARRVWPKRCDERRPATSSIGRSWRLLLARPARTANLFDAPCCRFKPEPSDQLLAPPGAEVVRTAEGVAVQLPGGARLPLAGLPFDKLRAVFAGLPCSYSRLTIELGSQTESFVEQAFSRVLFAPTAIAELETELPALEIVRFPGSPYEVVRSYWRNSCAVRRRLLEKGAPDDARELRALLLELHELLLLGEGDADERSSFYLPASLLGRKRPRARNLLRRAKRARAARRRDHHQERCARQRAAAGWGQLLAAAGRERC